MSSYSVQFPSEQTLDNTIASREIFLYCSQHTCVGLHLLQGSLVSHLTVLSGTSSLLTRLLSFWEHDTTCYLKLFSVMNLAFIYCIFMTKWLFPPLFHTKMKICQHLFTLILFQTYMLV